MIETKQIPHGLQLLVSDAIAIVPVNFYSTGKILVQGSSGELKDRIQGWIRQNPAPLATKPGKKAPKGLPELPSYPDRIGIDESGKGDYFGPLVICAAFVRAEEDGWLRELGVQDSKQLTTAKILDLVKQIHDVIPHEIVAIPPKRYNELDREIGNLNRLLAWGHARSLESLLERVSTQTAISDQFGDKSYLERALMAKGKAIELIQRHRAEQDTAVAVASIFARAEFLRRMDRMGKQFDMEFPRGASNIVETKAVEFVKKFGEERLGEVAKLHFKTTRKVLETLR